jgi:hypothetical protein
MMKDRESVKLEASPSLLYACGQMAGLLVIAAGVMISRGRCAAQ